MSLLRFSFVAVVAVVLASGLSAPAAEETKAQKLYKQYEALNSPENLLKPFSGGRPPKFIEEQEKLLGEISSQPEAESVPVLARIVDEYLKRVNDLGPGGFQGSPLKALQLTLVAVMSQHAKAKEMIPRIDAFAASPVVKEYALARILPLVVQRRLEEVRAGDDPDGRKRAAIIFDLMIGSHTLSRVLHAPARVRETAKLIPAGTGKTSPADVRDLVAETVSAAPRRYAADYAILRAAQVMEDGGAKLSDADKAAVMETFDRWMKDFRPAVAMENYPSDVVGQLLLELGGRKGNEFLTVALRKNGIKPLPPKPPLAPADVPDKGKDEGKKP